MEGEGDSSPYTQAVGLIKSLHSLVNSVRVSAPKCCCMDSRRWMTAQPVHATTVYCMSRIGLRRSGLWIKHWLSCVTTDHRYMPDHPTTDAQFTTLIRSTDASRAQRLADPVIARCPINGAGCRRTWLIDSRKQPMSLPTAELRAPHHLCSVLHFRSLMGVYFLTVHGRS